MKNIEVKILEHNLNGMPTFLAMLTQRGHQISCMTDLMKLYDKVIDKAPKGNLLTLPHTTIQRMNFVTVAIVGLSTKALTQFRTHAKRVTCISTSTQYSSFEGRPDNYVIPEGLDKHDARRIQDGYKQVQEMYTLLIKDGMDKDKAGYLLPQGLRKAFIMCANIDDWRYILRLRLCRRNTEETQYIARMIYNEIKKVDPIWMLRCLPECAYTKCSEGHFCCGKPMEEGEV